MGMVAVWDTLMGRLTDPEAAKGGTLRHIATTFLFYIVQKLDFYLFIIRNAFYVIDDLKGQ